MAEPETALERALLDREDALARMETDLQKERSERRVHELQLQKRATLASQVCTILLPAALADASP